MVAVLEFLPSYGMVTFLKDCNDSKGQGCLIIFGDHPKNSDHHRDGDHPRDGGCLRDFYHP